MAWWRRRTQGRVAAAAPLAVVATPKVERALVARAVHAQQLDVRLDRLERRIDAAAESQLDAPTHDDVLEVRVHSARVAAELARVSVELRAEMDDTVHHLETRLAEVAEGRPVTERERRIAAVAETIVDLTDRMDTMPSDGLRDVG